MSGAILLIHCKDEKGLIAKVTHFLWEHHANILDLDEHVDKHDHIFFMRVRFDLDGFDLAGHEIARYFHLNVASHYDKMNWELHFTDKVPRTALFVTKEPHCLYDILARWQAKEWEVEIPLIISNHDHLRPVAEQFSIPYFKFEVSKANKGEVEKKQLSLLRDHQIDFIVLARYMQVLSPGFIAHFPKKIINIHHSFLPAFPGAKPYHQAHARGVKLIGATSHYVTEELDHGPIIEQDVVTISHKDQLADLIRKGHDLEKIVLSRAIRTHLLRKSLVYKNKTIIFQ